MKQKMPKLTYIRLIMSGALAGTALFGVVAPLFGVAISDANYAVAGAIGAVVIAVGFKLARFA